MDTVKVKHKKTSHWKKLKRGVLLMAALLLLAIGSGFAYEAIASKQSHRDYPPPGKLVDAGGYSLHLVKAGTGSPTILLEAGSGETSLSWRQIPDELAEFATVVSYDRAGYAWSESANSERTGENIVHELHAALEKEGIRGPYLLVGHSLGGMYARLFAETYRDEVVGLVLIDARPEDDARDTAEILKQEKFAGNPSASTLKLIKHSGLLRLFKDELLKGQVAEEDRERFVNVIAKDSFFEAKEEEGNLAETTEDAIRGQRLGSLPVRVIARGMAQDYAQAGISEEGGRKLESIWQAGQRKMLEISTDSRLIVAEKSGHMVIHDQPELVVETIRSLLK
ncbi:pimeloyl-ACP methyl ester carboxylesterase [Fontibacillus phaseoli]|uniref:Pimeloyl-ACP methyl ester carboxylesterase n=2 Tax=Fontibacillus phaseoli TaxID=1416533 RepID=A0A369BJK5_9BACL|nr:alpha/beta hydrolase [Fontibacillus phaseoli]RCX21581.1 pimeloyl-ACP methyl ester carboxylesterase [Fontibacillus phaseoli]